MTVRLSDSDKDRILEYVCFEPEFNQFFIGDIENFGVDSHEVNVFAYASGKQWDCLVLRYINDYVLYSQKADYDAARAARFLEEQNAHVISGKASVIARLVPFFPDRFLRVMQLARCSVVKAEFPLDSGTVLRRLTVDDAYDMAQMMMHIDLYIDLYHDKKTAFEKISTNLSGGGTAFGVFYDGTLVCCAQTTAATALGAMVSGVATHPKMRGRGYASATVSALCRDALSCGSKYLCLFYDNPDAGRIYERIGFEPVGEYAVFQRTSD